MRITRIHNRVLVFGLLAACFMIALAAAGPAGTVSASEPGVHGGEVKAGEQAPHDADVHADRSADIRDLMYRILNFVILVVVLVIAVKKSGMKDSIGGRIDEIKQKLESLNQDRETKERAYREMEQKLRDFEAERRQIIDQFKQEGIAEKERIIKEANERAANLLRQAEAAIQQEVASARERLKLEVVGLATRKAGEIISREITEKDQNRLVEDFIERVGKVH